MDNRELEESLKSPRVLMFINFFPPSAGGGVYRPLSFVKYLSRLSWDITVITPRPGGFWISDPALMREVPDSVRVIRTGSLSGQSVLGNMNKKRSSRRSSGRFGILRKFGEYFLVPDTYVGWIPFACMAARALPDESFDIIYSTSPPDSTHLAARKFARRTRIPWVADFRDPWIGLHLRKPPTPFHRSIHRRMETRIMEADRVIVTTDWQKKVLEENHPGCRVKKIPNGFDEEDFAEAGTTATTGDATDGSFRIVHCGMLTLGRTSGPFLDGLNRFLRARPESRGRVKVVFAGARESDNEELVHRFGLSDTVEFMDNLPHSQCVKLERASHILLMIKHDDEKYRGLIPGKLFEYIGARRPILAIAPEGEAASIIARENRGEVVSHGSPEKVADILTRFYDLFLAGKLEEAYSLDELSSYSRREAAATLDVVMRGMIDDAAEKQ